MLAFLLFANPKQKQVVIPCRMRRIPLHGLTFVLTEVMLYQKTLIGVCIHACFLSWIVTGQHSCFYCRENLLADCLQGCFVVTCTLCAFISLVWLREQIVHGGAPQWLEQNLPQPLNGLGQQNVVSFFKNFFPFLYLLIIIS